MRWHIARPVDDGSCDFSSSIDPKTIRSSSTCIRFRDDDDDDAAGDDDICGSGCVCGVRVQSRVIRSQTLVDSLDDVLQRNVYTSCDENVGDLVRSSTVDQQAHTYRMLRSMDLIHIRYDHIYCRTESKLKKRALYGL